MRWLVNILQDVIQEHATLVLAAFAAIGVLAAGAASQVRIDTSVDSLLMANDPDRARNQALKGEFSNDEAILVAFDVGRPFDANDLGKLRRVSAAVGQIDGVEEVLDLATIKDVRGTADALDPVPLVNHDTVDRDIDAIRARVRGHRLYRNNLVSDDLHVLALIAILDTFSQSERATRTHAATAAVLAIVEAEAPPWTVYFSGYPTAEYEANRILRRDFAFLSITALVVILAIVYAATRKGFALMLVALLVVWAELITLAWFGGSTIPLSPVSSAVPTIIVGTSAAYVIYFLGLLATVSTRPAPGVAVVERLARPVILSAGSTAIGFLSLRYINVQVIGEAGTGLAVGIAGAAVGTLLLLPAIAHRFDLRLDTAHGNRSTTWSLWGVRLARRPRLVVLIAGVLTLTSIPGILKIRFDTDILRQFHRDNRVRLGDNFIRDRLSGAFIVNVIVRTSAADGVLDPTVLGFTHSLVQRIEQSPIVDRTISFLDYLYLMDRALHPGEPLRIVPATRRAAAQSMLLYEMAADPRDYRHYINDDRSALNVYVRMSPTSAEAVTLVRQIETFAAAAPAGCHVEVLGTATLFHRAMMGITDGMAMGLGIALALITATITLMLRSPTLGLVALVPNIVPILVCGALLGWLGIPLSMGTSLVGCVALGLAVDDTAHVLGHVTGHRALDQVYLIVGRPLILTTVALGVGFSTLMLSAFESVAMLGAGTSIALFVALLSNILLLPSLLVLIGYPRTATTEASRGIDGVAVAVEMATSPIHPLDPEAVSVAQADDAARRPERN